MNAQSEPPKSFFDSLRNSTAVRPRERWIGGVSGAIQARTGFDLALIRGLFIVAGFFGIGFVAYGLAWAFLPEKDTGQIVAEDISRGQLTGALFGAGAFVFIGLWTPFNFAGWVFGGNLLVIPSWIGIIIVAIVMLATVTRQSRNTAPVPPPSMPPTEPIVPPAPPHSESYTHAVPTHAVPTHAAPRTQTAQTEQTVQTEQSAQTE